MEVVRCVRMRDGALTMTILEDDGSIGDYVYRSNDIYRRQELDTLQINVPIEIEPEPGDAVVTFPRLTPRQFGYALLNLGMTEADILAEIDTIADEFERERARIDYQKATYFERDWPLVDLVAAKIGLPSDIIDSYWIEASEY